MVHSSNKKRENTKKFNYITNNFNIKSVDAVKITNGLLNATYLVTDEKGRQYILQRVNTFAFKKPNELMSNIVQVTCHIRKKVTENGGNPDRESMTVLQTVNGESYYTDPAGNCWRMYLNIEGAKSHNVADENLLYEAGVGFGRFQTMLADFPIEKLYDIIPDFHNTVKRIEALNESVKFDNAGRSASVADIVDFINNHKYLAERIVNKLETGIIPTRVVHNDTKLNNVMMDEKTNKAVCVIDLDTVMAGSLLYDYGDAVRSACNTTTEDEKDLSKVQFAKEKFTAFTKGFLSETYETITKEELKELAYSPLVVTYELASRFLTDYINGDVYFAVDENRPEHNLDRTLNQLKLYREIEKNMPFIKETILETLKELVNTSKNVSDEKKIQHKDVEEFIKESGSDESK